MALSDLGHMLDWAYSRARLDVALADPVELESPYGPRAERALHVAVRRRRPEAVGLLLDAGVLIDARTVGGKTAYAHALRRGFDEIAGLLARRGADTSLDPADRFAVAVVQGRLDGARALLEEHPGAVRTGNPEEDRLLADVAGRLDPAPVAFLIEAGADLEAPGLDDGAPLHQAAWFGSPENARLLIGAGAPVNAWEGVHGSTPLGWAVHGSRYSGGAAERQDVYVTIVRALLEAGATLAYPSGTDAARSYRERLDEDASPEVRRLLEEWGEGGG